MKIDTSKWGEFKVEELFDIFLSKDDIQPKNIIDGSIPLISSGKTNNGITTYIENNTAKIWKGNVLTVDMFGKVFYQKDDFCCVSHGRVNILISKKEYSQYILQFIGTSLEKITEKYEFTEMCTSKKLLKDKLYLPITSDGEPDYKYMEEYMKKIENTVSSSLTKIQSVQNKKKEKIDVSSWKEFKVGDFFDIHHGKRIKKTDRIDGNTIFITAGKENFGVIGKIGNDIEIWNKPITVDMFGNSFYHDYKCSGDDNIYAFINDNLNSYVKMFISTIINRYSEYSYKEQFRQKNADNLTIKLPVTSNGEPDYKYMEEYMKKIEEKTQEKLSKLNL